MFDQFGEFDSWEELNKAAAGQKEEGDMESLAKLAAENGITTDDVTKYCNGDTEGLCTPITAALGKIDIESAELKPQQIENDWIEYIQQQIIENNKFALAVRRKGKSLFACEGELLKYAEKHMFEPHKDVMKAAGISGRVKLGMPGWAREKRIIKDYYLGGKA